jgi:hypothetical protein
LVSLPLRRKLTVIANVRIKHRGCRMAGGRTGSGGPRGGKRRKAGSRTASVGGTSQSAFAGMSSFVDDAADAGPAINSDLRTESGPDPLSDSSTDSPTETAAGEVLQKMLNQGHEPTDGDERAARDRAAGSGEDAGQEDDDAPGP